ncbi:MULTISPECIES: hypothetical protein [unclassified Escherichia]|uniref:hypothetical protein n=1 Tax=unclassified Escherichia TaxID=2608889 RepID=UPI00102A6CDD|nr:MULTISPECIES: hypothetical protein [unclassified Escherichia]RZM88597.1 hypothetical protein D9742_08230 [Escherichia sp. E1V33]TBR69918.1 hypothetical protein D9735_04865 [Escherichia sp. E1S7]
MELQEWVDRLRWLSHEQIVQVHFGLQEEIKKYYKLRDEANNLARAEHLCEQMIALTELAFPALKRAHDKRVEEYESLTGNKYPSEFYPPSHYGFSQLVVILKKRKDYKRIEELREKMIKDGWRC